MTESGAPKHDTPDSEDFEGEPQESEQQPEEAPPEVAGRGGRDEKRGDDGSDEPGHGHQRGEREERS